MAAHQAPPSLGFSRQEHWSGLPFPSSMHEVKSESEVTRLCSTLWDPTDCSLPGSSIHGILQARVLEWGAIAFSAYGYNYILFKLSSIQQPFQLNSSFLPKAVYLKSSLNYQVCLKLMSQTYLVSIQTHRETCCFSHNSMLLSSFVLTSWQS